MRKDKQKALRLRKNGKSYREIKRVLGTPTSTLSEWLSPHGWSNNIKTALIEKSKGKNSIRLLYLNKIRRKHLARLYQEAQQESKIEFEKFKYHPLFIAGLMLYLGEGDKISKYQVRISNTDPNIVKIFVNFLLYVCQVPNKKIKAGLLIYPDLNDATCKKFWIKNNRKL